MTLVQLEYIVALDRYRHFSTAAMNCFVTQPTLSMQVHKLEEELGVKIFDRSKQPVIPTEAGAEVIAHAKRIIAEKEMMQEMISNRKGVISGELKVGIIPTLAPYLLPLFVKQFTQEYPGVKLIVNEMMTDLIINRLRDGSIHAGILVTPLQEYGIREDVLFYEELLVYVSKHNHDFKKKYVLAQDIDPQKLWLLEEGHCFRSQIMNLCELQKASKQGHALEYEAGSIETLRRMVELSDGITILPELASRELTTQQKKQLREFKRPAPMREVSIVLHRDFVKKKLVEALKEAIMASIPEKIKKNRTTHVIPV
jgi:LysR family hydrogen peroxide-inducible transcriptional activator